MKKRAVPKRCRETGRARVPVKPKRSVHRSRSTAKAKKTTTILTSEAAPVHLAAHLEQLLVAFAHGDQGRVEELLAQMCQKSEVKRLNAKASQLLESFHASIWSLKDGFDASSLTLTSTSLPEASKGLDRVLVRAGEAAHKVLSLVEQQEGIQVQGEQLLLALEKQLASGTIDRAALERGLIECRALVAQTRKIASEMVYTQDFEDLCGQVIYKVRRLILTLEEQIRGLLLHLKVELPQSAQEAGVAERERVADQASVDALLKSFGL